MTRQPWISWAVWSVLVACTGGERALNSDSSPAPSAGAGAGTSGGNAAGSGVTAGEVGPAGASAAGQGATGGSTNTSAKAGTGGAGSGGSAGSGGAPMNGVAGMSGASGSSGAAAMGGAGAPAPFEGEGQPWMAPLPRATCGEGDTKDGALQGAPGDLKCNLDLGARIEVSGMGIMTWYKDCAYVNTSDATIVIHVAEDGTLAKTAMLTQTGFQANWETLKASEKSGLLAGYESLGSTLAVADLSKDCTKPEFLTGFQVPGSVGGGSLGHAGNFNPDGTIYYPTSLFSSDVSAVDLKDPRNPKLITSDFARIGSHDIFIGKGGTRAYMASSVSPGLPGDASQVGSVAIMDTTDIEARKPGAKATLVHTIQWEDGNATQFPIQVTYRGKDFLMITDELGSGSCGDPKSPIWGYARLIDISEEKNPKTVSLIRTEAQHPDFCEHKDQAPPGAIGFGAGTHYCDVDRLDDPRVLACGNWAGGLRLHDIRNPWQPKELAYYGVANEEMPGRPRIHIEKREVWFTTNAGFYVVKIRPGSALDKILSEP